MAPLRYHARGFIALSQIEDSALRYYTPESAVEITLGDALYMTSGTASLAGDADWTAAFAGIASGPLSAADATLAVKIGVIPPLPQYQFMVPVEENTVLVATTHIGGSYGPEDAYNLDLADSSETSYLFFIDDIDISAAAIAANTYGYAIGHFVHIT